jgi:hypothetical protein
MSRLRVCLISWAVTAAGLFALHHLMKAMLERHLSYYARRFWTRVEDGFVVLKATSLFLEFAVLAVYGLFVSLLAAPVEAWLPNLVVRAKRPVIRYNAKDIV